ncbi:small s protein [Diplodia corticola]|uniref:Small s protein n=1 Tax=Diplodia corticola TaxID=236234 RepID=A0A1J9QXL3_9PEZI|nr:small s protein [Diplodia corticola]OJD33128.1 small s protein [Diplodia corticola]
MLLCVNAFPEIRSLILGAVHAGAVDGNNPYGWHRHIVDEVLRLYDTSFWGLRDLVRDHVEKKRDILTANKFRVLNEVARHLTHLEETLEVAITTLESMQSVQDILRDDISRLDLENEVHRLLRENALDLFHACNAAKASAARARSLSTRLGNETNLAFNLVTQSDSRSMKLISIVTLVFLPASYVACGFDSSHGDLVGFVAAFGGTPITETTEQIMDIASVIEEAIDGRKYFCCAVTGRLSQTSKLAMAEMATETLNFLNAALSCFERIQIARSFEQNFDTHQIKLDIIQLRLSRWGEAAGIYATQHGAEKATLAVTDCAEANSLLQEIGDLFTQARENAEKLRPKDTSTPQGSLDPNRDMRPLMKTLRTKLRKSLSRRCARLTNAVHSVQWAFYKKEQYEEFVSDISGLVDQLEMLFPQEESTTARLRELSTNDCAGIGRTYLKALKDVVTECDPWLDVAVDTALRDSAPVGGSVTFTNRDTFGLQVGYHNGPMKGLSFGTGNTTNNHFKA